MKPFTSLRVRLVGFVFLVLTMALLILVYAKQSWVMPSFCMGLLSLVAAWVGGQLFVLNQVKSISKTADSLSKGDLSTRTGLVKEPGELGELGRSIDKMAEQLQRQAAEQDLAQTTLKQKILLEEQLRQSQKMESIGQLAAGVAHDFNNILTIIQGHAGLMLSFPGLSPSLGNSVQSISFASERAASLTRQLLLFSRKQVVQPRPTDLKVVVNDLSKMLQRWIGENIVLECRHPDSLPRINGDSGMMEQIIMNLAVNARDAMPRGGTLTIATGEVHLTEEDSKRRGEARTGDFVCIEISDTGTGMDEATMARIFEPFFTTKSSDQGTGLGLATVYGIVKQHSGWIEVTSKPGCGSTFRIFLPALAAFDAEGHPTEFVENPIVKGGNERILIAEDEPVLRDLAQLILQDFGYQTVCASSGVDALELWRKTPGAFDMLLTDMIMPEGITGKELADTLLNEKPDLKILFTSGYNVDESYGISSNGGGNFLQKPYSRLQLARAVRKCLDLNKSPASQ